MLPRHWEWLAQQPGGASVAMRKLVDEARRASEDKDRIRQAQEAAYRFMSVMADNRPHYEEASRALFAGDAGPFRNWTPTWPADVRDHAAGWRRRVRTAIRSGAPVDRADANG